MTVSVKFFESIRSVGKSEAASQERVAGAVETTAEVAHFELQSAGFTTSLHVDLDRAAFGFDSVPDRIFDQRLQKQLWDEGVFQATFDFHSHGQPVFKASP